MQVDFVGRADELTEQQIVAQMELLLGSAHFRQAKSLEKFLRYIVAKKLTNCEHELKEYTIGVDVYRRGQEFDPRLDAVVRVQASVLRKKLVQYYAGEGAADEVLIELPKGHYVPRFSRRPTAPVAAEESSDRHSPIVLKPESAPASFTRAPEVAADASLRRNFRPPDGWMRIAATFVIGILSVLVVQQWRGVGASPVASSVATAPTLLAATGNPSAGAADAGVDAALLPLWKSFLEPDAKSVLAYGVPLFFSANGVYLRDVEVNDAPVGRTGVAGRRLAAIEKELRSSFVPAEIYTGVGETHGVYLLSRFFWKLGHELRVERSRMVRWNDLKDSNLIFLSSMRFHTLANELPFPTDFVIDESSQPLIKNLRPRDGEPKEYVNERALNQEYAVITVWPGKSENRRVILLSGTTTWATLAAAEYVTDRGHLRHLNQQLAGCRHQSEQSHAPYFQVLVRAEIKDNQPVKISYVTHHDLEITETNGDAPRAPDLISRRADAPRPVVYQDEP